MFRKAVMAMAALTPSSTTIDLLSRSGETERKIALELQISDTGENLFLTVTPVSVR